MLFGFTDEISVIAMIDGEGCESEESVFGYYGLILWSLIAMYLMAGQFVICEEYFVPILARLGGRWKMAEDVQGATLLAVGSSSPELFTAVLGAVLYPDDNPGPSTNVGSAIFNLCIIIGLSALYAPRVATLEMVPFLRDTISYLIGLAMLYVFYMVVTPGEMELWEASALTGWWVVYALMVYFTDFLAKRCCCCLGACCAAAELAENVNVPDQSDEEDEGDDEEDLEACVESVSTAGASTTKKPKHKRGRSTLHRSNGHWGVSFPKSDNEQSLSSEFYHDNIHLSSAIQEEDIEDEDMLRLVDEQLNSRQRELVNRNGWQLVVMPPVSQAEDAPRHLHLRRPTLMELWMKQQVDARVDARMDEVRKNQLEEAAGPSRLSKAFHICLKPWEKLFSFTLFKRDGEKETNHMYVAIFLMVVQLGLLTFLVVDCCEKIGVCLEIPGNLLGITLLAVGSSLPDCISSVIVAKEMKLDMAVANAFGSNIFDVNLCVGFSFVIGSLVKASYGESTTIWLGDEADMAAFSKLIITAAIYLGLAILAMWLNLMKLTKLTGGMLLLMYAIFLIYFIQLFLGEQ